MTEQRRRWKLAIRWLLTICVLGGLVWWLDVEQLARELGRFTVLAVGMALLVSVVQVAVSAWRWQYTAGQLGLPLSFGRAVREYYLALFLNQCLPGGVVGDVNRAWRHGQHSDQGKASLHAVMIERLSGQLVMVLVAVASCIWLSLRFPELGSWLSRVGQDWSAFHWLAVIALVLVVFFGARAWTAARQYFHELGRDIRLGLFNRLSLPLQLGSSLLVVMTYLSVFLLLAGSSGNLSGVENTTTLLALCSLLLAAMVIPLTVAGWGVREGAAALLWPLAGLPAEQGVALSVGYGLTVFLSSLPGALFVFSRPVAR